MAPRVGVRRGRRLTGVFTPPGDKSITHRALLFGLVAKGVTSVRGANVGEDCGRSAAAAGALGARVRVVDDGWDITGTAGILICSDASFDCGNSGTTLRLLAGILAGRPLECTLTGDASLSRRPMRRIAEPLARMGAALHGQGESCMPPLTVRGALLRGIDYVVPMASAQVATCVLLAGLSAADETRVTLPGPARDHTERMLPAFGVELACDPAAHGGRSIRVRGGAMLHGTSVQVPGDFSAAAFMFAAAACEPGASITALGVNLNPTRTGFLDVLRAMGAGVFVANETVQAGEPVGDVTVTGPEALSAFDVPGAWLPRMVDEVPVWAVVASVARGTSRLTGAGELRVKESDRLASIAAGLGALGVVVEERPDGLAVTGGPVRGGVRIITHHDHRIAMAFAVLGCRTGDPILFDDLASVPTSYPGFFETLAALGGELVPDPSGDRT
jgi:3-phosphoshikimate 1-carboxyvinyltransferase